MMRKLFEILRGRKKSLHTDPGLTMEAVWDDLNAPPGRRSGRYHRTFHQHIQYFDADSRESILRDLLAIEQHSLKAEDSLGFIREKIMDLMDNKLCAEHLDAAQKHRDDPEEAPGAPPLPDASLLKAAADCEVQIAALRKFSIRKYGDGGARGWFACYRHVSRFFHQRMFNGSLSAAAPLDLAFEGRSVAADKESFQDLRCRFRKAYVGEQFNLQIKTSSPEAAP